MKVKHEFYKSPKDLPTEEFLSGGSPLCAGCGGLTTLRLMHKVLGGNVIVINAAGCMTLMAVYPFTPLHSSWLYTTMGSAAAGAQGVRDALDILLEKKRMPEDENLKVVVLAGDGSTYDMGLSATSGAIHRNLDFWYLCYDNEAYGNTGFQQSSGSPRSSHTSTSTDEGHQHKKDIFELWRSQKPPYVATVSSHDPVDLAEKVRRAESLAGPKLFLALAVCPTGWGFEPALSEDVAKSALSTGIWPLKEAVNGVVRHTYVPNTLHPVEEYLKPQRRFRHLFEPERDEEGLAHIQHDVDEYWKRVRDTEEVRIKIPNI
jgi:pyruvate ferredoxin oxidoreductase beta subunit